MNIVVDGTRYEGFVGAWVEVRLSALSRKFQFEATSRSVKDIPFRPGQSCVVMIGDEPIMTGWIETLSLRARADGVSYTIGGRDRLCDLIDSSADGLSDVGSTVSQAARAVLRTIGIPADVVDETDSDARPLFHHLEIASPESGDSAYGFLFQIAVRRQVLVTSDGAGNLVLTNGAGVPSGGSLVNRASGIGNNLLSSSYEVDHSQRFGVYTVESQANLAAVAEGRVDLDEGIVAYAQQVARDPEIRSSRRRAVSTESTYDGKNASARARWEMNLARARSRNYSVEVAGFRDQTGALWAVNTAPLVVDEFAGIAGRLLIVAVRYEAGGDGEFTKLDLTDALAFSQEVSDDVAEPYEIQ